jgi:putative tryptophan/tyrosine transport system substrate-binding protein
VRRREFIAGLGAAAWPVAARAQQQGLPVVGFLHDGSPEPFANRAAGFRKGLNEAGFVEGRNVAIEYRWAHNDANRLPEPAADLVSRQVAVIAALSVTTALSAKAATATIPIIFGTSEEPVQAGLVSSLNRPGGNLTGINSMAAELGAKRLGLLHELVPGADRFALLVDAAVRPRTETMTTLQSAAAAIGKQVEAFYASTRSEINAAFASFMEEQIDAVLISPDVLFADRRVQIVTLASHYKVPAIYYSREFADAGGLMSYGPNLADLWRQTAIYVGRVLKGEKPADLPVARASKFEFIINSQTAELLAIEIPPTLLAIADEVIE